MANMGKMVLRICRKPGCKKCFEARLSDAKRGWANFCSKSCKVRMRRGEEMDMEVKLSAYQIMEYEKHKQKKNKRP